MPYYRIRTHRQGTITTTRVSDLFFRLRFDPSFIHPLSHPSSSPGAMASTNNPTPTSTSSSSEPRPIPIKVAARKLPIKRKNPDHDDLNTINPNPNSSIPNNPSSLPIPKIETAEDDDDDDEEDDDEQDIKRPAPFKFHRIWTEIDEIRFLQGLLDSSSQGLIFPRDLHLFYQRFSGIMSQPYTKSQLSEKLRRLRKKFRVISGRISRGLDESMLTSHDRSLFQLCKKLWHPDLSPSSPFQASSKIRAAGVASVNNDNVVGVVKNFEINNGDDILVVGHDLNPLSVNVGDGYGKIITKTIMDVFDKSLEDVRASFLRQGMYSSSEEEMSAPTTVAAGTTVPDESSKEENGNVADMRRRFREQRFAELDVLARRMRLVLEHSTNDQ